MIDVIAPAVTAMAVIALLIGHHRGNARMAAVAKTVASASFVGLAATRWTAGSAFDSWLLAALVLGAAGDILLLSDHSFDAGLGCFLAGHICLAVAFHHRLPIARWPTMVLLSVAVIGAVIYRWLWPRLGRRRVPVALYITGITVMVWGAISVSWFGPLPYWTGLAAVLFMLSDVAVARQRFVVTAFANRAAGLPMYYLAQILLAFTIGR